MTYTIRPIIWTCILTLFFSCGHDDESTAPVSHTQEAPVHTPRTFTDEFGEYWYQGVAELTSFKLEQARYGEMREGVAVAVFVTEDFSRSRYVKLDYPKKAGDDAVKVLKFNLNKRFTTGIYDYTLMQSVFTPVNRTRHPHTLRVTTSNIEWCGQFLTSTWFNGDSYEVQYRSYFDGEETLHLELPHVGLEDELWNLIRIAPETLPEGDTMLVPSILTQELTHKPLRAERAICHLEEGDEFATYTITYPEIARMLAITYEVPFPHRIVKWEETFESVSGWGLESKVMTTRATRIETTMSDYWNQKFNRHEHLRRDSLGLRE